MWGWVRKGLKTIRSSLKPARGRERKHAYGDNSPIKLNSRVVNFAIVVATRSSPGAGPCACRRSASPLTDPENQDRTARARLALSPALSVIVVSYNTRAMTLDCLASLRDETRADFETIVVDNASTDGSAEAIAAAFPEMVLLAETANHGFAGANNLAARRARGEYLLLLNPDTLVLDGAVDRLLAFARARPEAGIWGGRTLYGDRSLNPASCWGRMTLWNLFCRACGPDRRLSALGALQFRGLLAAGTAGPSARSTSSRAAS